jgi:uncharacterized membrane protein
MIWFRRSFFTLVALAIVQVIYYYPQMPDIVASHFDGLGAPNDWSGKKGFFGLYLAILLMLIAVFEWVPRWSQSRIGFGRKIPNQEYWLAPERLEQTKAFFRRQMYLMGIAHLLLTIYAIQLAILANFDPEPRLHASIGWALLMYFVFLAAWLIHFFMHFRRP